MFLTLVLASFLSYTDDNNSLIESDLKGVSAEDATFIRYLIIPDDLWKNDTKAVVSFVLNSISDNKKITVPMFLTETKNVIKVDLRNYGIKPEVYELIDKDIYTKLSKYVHEKTKSKNGVMRADYFIIKAMTAPGYYQLIQVKNLQDFRKRHFYDAEGAKKAKAEHAAVVSNSTFTIGSRYIKRINTLSGPMWEARDSKKMDYLRNLTSEEYDYMQVLALNGNGLISYFACDDKGNALDFLSVEVAVDKIPHFQSNVTKIARSCVGCHTTGVLPINDVVRKMFSDGIEVKVKDLDRISDLFTSDLPVKADKDLYVEALEKATGMGTWAFNSNFIGIWKNYYRDLDLKQCATELGYEIDEFKTFCKESGNPHLLNLVVNDKISRIQLEKAMEK